MTEDRPDLKVHIGNRVVLLDVRACALTTAGTSSDARCAAAPGCSAELGANSKQNDRGTPCHRMNCDSIPLEIEAGGRQADAAEGFSCRVVGTAGAGYASDRARFHHHAAFRIPMAKLHWALAWHARIEERSFRTALLRQAPLRHTSGLPLD